MKRIIYYLIFGVLTFGVCSCSGDFLDTYPADSVDPNAVFTNTTTAMGAVNGIHRILYEKFRSNASFQGGGGQGGMMCILDLMAEDVVVPAIANQYMGVTRWTAHTNEASVETNFAWSLYYKVIANANEIIGRIDGAEGPQSERDMIKGQALAYRGWGYFMLVQLYGKRYDPQSNNDNPGVPLMTFESPEPKARSTVAQIYAQINADLDAAIGLLEGYERSNKSHIDRSVAMGFKARVLLAQGQWEAAARMADQAAAGYTFMSTAQQYQGYNDYTNPEWMWGHMISGDQQIDFQSFFAYMSCNYASRGIRDAPRLINSLLYNRMATTDIRRGRFWIPDARSNPAAVVTIPSGGTKYDYMTQKFLSENENSSNGCVPCMRVSEMYLIAAEGYARAGSSTLDLARDRLFSLMRTRNPSYVRSTAPATQLIDDILIARRLELWGEGFRWLDLKRLNVNLDRSGANHIASVSIVISVPAGDTRWQWKIPRSSEIDANPWIEQNP